MVRPHGVLGTLEIQKPLRPRLLLALRVGSALGCGPRPRLWSCLRFRAAQISPGLVVRASRVWEFGGFRFASKGLLDLIFLEHHSGAPRLSGKPVALMRPHACSRLRIFMPSNSLLTSLIRDVNFLKVQIEIKGWSRQDRQHGHA